MPEMKKAQIAIVGSEAISRMGKLQHEPKLNPGRINQQLRLLDNSTSPTGS
jgi:hypothetical protein